MLNETLWKEQLVRATLRNPDDLTHLHGFLPGTVHCPCQDTSGEVPIFGGDVVKFRRAGFEARFL